jgi:hypothetical protein
VRLAQAGITVIEEPAAELVLEDAALAVRTINDSWHRFDTLYVALGLRARSGLATALGAEHDPEGALAVTAMVIGQACWRRLAPVLHRAEISRYSTRSRTRDVSTMTTKATSFRFSGPALAELDRLAAALRRATSLEPVTTAQALEWALRRGLAELDEQEAPQLEEAAATYAAEPQPDAEPPAGRDHPRPAAPPQERTRSCVGSLHQVLAGTRCLVPPRTAPLPFLLPLLQPRLL